jgi:hypothetical protein
MGVQSIVEKFIELNPPIDIMPKSYNMPDDLPRSGGGNGFLKLTKFRGQDHGKSKIQKDDEYEQFVFPANI